MYNPCLFIHFFFFLNHWIHLIRTDSKCCLMEVCKTDEWFFFLIGKTLKKKFSDLRHSRSNTLLFSTTLIHKFFFFFKCRLVDQNYFNKVDTNKRAICVNQCIKLYDRNIQLDGWRDKSPQGLEQIASNPLKKKKIPWPAFVELKLEKIEKKRKVQCSFKKFQQQWCQI